VTGLVPSRKAAPAKVGLPAALGDGDSLGGVVERLAKILASAETRADAAAADGISYSLDHLRLMELAADYGLDADPEAKALLDRRRDKEVQGLARLYRT